MNLTPEQRRDPMTRCHTCDRPLATPELEAHVDGCECAACVSHCWSEYGAACEAPDWRGRAMRAEAMLAELAGGGDKMTQPIDDGVVAEILFGAKEATEAAEGRTIEALRRSLSALSIKFSNLAMSYSRRGMAARLSVAQEARERAEAERDAAIAKLAAVENQRDHLKRVLEACQSRHVGLMTERDAAIAKLAEVESDLDRALDALDAAVAKQAIAGRVVAAARRLICDDPRVAQFSDCGIHAAIAAYDAANAGKEPGR